jgi:hypothetical protein
MRSDTAAPEALYCVDSPAKTIFNLSWGAIGLPELRYSAAVARLEASREPYL